jgi:hypothetical protein
MELYQRDRSILTRTLPYYQFKRDFTTVNDYYWGAGSALQAVAGRVRHMKSSDDFHTELGLVQQKYDKPLGHTPQKYAQQLMVSNRWHRLLTLVTLTSAFERYLTAVTTTAIASDPVLEPGFPKKIDGLTLAKYRLQAGERSTEALTKGEWSGRLAAFRKYFGTVPSILQSHEGTLETMRNTRNQVAHSFGLDTSSMPAHSAMLIGARRKTTPNFDAVSVSEATIKKWLATIDACATAIDGHLLPNFIGGYEIAAICIEWIEDRDRLHKATGIRLSGNGSDARKLGKFLGELLAYPVQHETAQAIIDYIDRLLIYLLSRLALLALFCIRHVRTASRTRSARASCRMSWRSHIP